MIFEVLHQSSIISHPLSIAPNSSHGKQYHFPTSEPVLSKWYFDCVDDAGDVAIAYSARIAWMQLSLSYNSFLVNRSGVTQAREHVGGAPPLFDHPLLTWSDAHLGVRAALEGQKPPHRETLIDGVEWHCVMPAAGAAFEFDDGPPIRGRGYAEFLEMKVAPWQLPVDELRWGRFAGAKTAVTWIEWRGEHPLTLVLVDGVRSQTGTVSDESIGAGDVTLTIARDRVIRDASIGETMKHIPLLLPLLPSRIANARETKWCGRAATSTESGWAVHEIVRFG